MLTSGLFTNIRENGLSFEDFEDRKIVLFGDEAHHNNAPVWGEIVTRIHKMNYENILLEFTATLDYESREITEKYQDKVIQKYDLAQFRIDKYSKEINLIRSLYEERERIIQALILNLYRQELATSRGINLKPVILFKAKRTIKESEQNKINFHNLIDDFSTEMVSNIQKTSTVAIVQKAFAFFKKRSLSLTEIAKRIKFNFKEENCISANNDKEAELNQIRLNTLEDGNNPIRAVFAVQKLNEGWDVLNLFDIVRLYEGRDGKNGVPGKTTLSEAQLIGRGARYFPFTLDQDQDQYTRKYDDDISNDLKILEELYYHTKEDSRYISEIKKALVDSGIYEDDDNLVTKDLKIKESFKDTPFYKTGAVFFNEKAIRSYENVKSISDLDVSLRNYVHILSSGSGKVGAAFSDSTEEDSVASLKSIDIKLSDISFHVIRFTLTKNPFFHFNNLIKFFPNLKSLSQFVNDKNYLHGLEITLKGSKKRLEQVCNHDYLVSISGFLDSIESDLKSNLSKYVGSQFFSTPIADVFKDKKIRVPKDSIKAEGQEDIVEEADWYVFK